jgi:hypothetical protein
MNLSVKDVENFLFANKAQYDSIRKIYSDTTRETIIEVEANGGVNTFGLMKFINDQTDLQELEAKVQSEIREIAIERLETRQEITKEQAEKLRNLTQEVQNEKI